MQDNNSMQENNDHNSSDTSVVGQGSVGSGTGSYDMNPVLNHAQVSPSNVNQPDVSINMNNSQEGTDSSPAQDQKQDEKMMSNQETNKPVNNTINQITQESGHQQLSSAQSGSQKSKEGFFASLNLFSKKQGKSGEGLSSSQDAGQVSQASASPASNNVGSLSPYIQAQQKPKKNSFRMLIISLLILLSLIAAFLYLNKVKDDDIGEPTDAEGEVVWWGLEDEEIYKSVIEKYEQENQNVKILYVQKPAENYRERLSNAFGNGTAPDMFTFHNSWVPMFRNRLDKIPPSVMSVEEFENTFYPIMMADLSTQEGVFGMPLEYDAITLYINTEVFSTAGKMPPTKWDQLEVLARELTQRDSRGLIIQAGAPLGYINNIDYWPEILGLMIYQNYAVPSSPRSQRATSAMRFYREFVNDNVWSNILPPSTVAFANGDAAMYFGPAESASQILSQNPDLQFKTINVPQLRKDNPEEVDITYATYMVQGVWNRSEHRGVAWNFLKYLSSRESLEEIYNNSVEVKKVGDPYPRKDMAPLLRNDPILGSVVALAPNAKSWYLSSMVDDGETGLSSKLNLQFGQIIGSNVDGDTLDENAGKISNILIEYGLKSKPGFLGIE